MSTTPTLLDLIDAYAEARHTNGDSTYNATTKAARDAVVAALTQGAGEAVVDKSPDLQGSLVDKSANLQGRAGEAVEPVATFVERADGRPVATAVWLNSMPNPDWDLEMLDSAYPQFAPHRLVDLVRAQQLQQAVAREREECAKVCDAQYRVMEARRAHAEGTLGGANHAYFVPAMTNVAECAAAIRAKGTHD